MFRDGRVKEGKKGDCKSVDDCRHRGDKSTQPESFAEE
jgi:hypothetical protein